MTGNLLSGVDGHLCLLPKRWPLQKERAQIYKSSGGQFCYSTSSSTYHGYEHPQTQFAYMHNFCLNHSVLFKIR